MGANLSVPWCQQPTSLQKLEKGLRRLEAQRGRHEMIAVARKTECLLRGYDETLKQIRELDLIMAPTPATRARKREAEALSDKILAAMSVVEAEYEEVARKEAAQREARHQEILAAVLRLSHRVWNFVLPVVAVPIVLVWWVLVWCASCGGKKEKKEKIEKK